MEHLVSQKSLWEKFERGDGLTLAEVQALIKQTEEAMPYLHDRSAALGTNLACHAVLTLHRLRDFEKELVKRRVRSA